MAASTASTFQDLPVNKLIAGVLWLVGVWATYASIVLLFGATPPPWYVPLLTALAVQAGLTATERHFFNGNRNEIGIIALVIDVLFNAGGLYTPMSRIGMTPPGRMLADVFGASAEVGKLSALALAIGIGYALARAPEFLWDAD